jgi:coatomer subunit beta
VRGSTLRFLCKLKEAEILEPLVPSVRANLEYRHAYVRRNAVLAVYSIYKAFSFLIPDASELIFNFLNTVRALCLHVLCLVLACPSCDSRDTHR